MRKRFSAWLVLCLMLTTAVLHAPAALAAAPEEGIDSYRYGEVSTEKGTLNMRAEAKDNAKILHKIPRGTIVRITGEDGNFTKILYKDREGFVKSSFIREIDELPFQPITSESDGDAVLAFKRILHRLEYIKADDINMRFDQTMENALSRMQLMNGVSYDPQTVTPELQALIEWGMISKGKSGYLDAATDAESGLTVAIFCWDTAGTLYEKDSSVKVQIAYGAQATGGVPPYTITVRKSLGAGGAEFGDEVQNPFSHIWSPSTDRLYVYATAEDSAGNTVTACAPYRYVLPARYTDGG